MIELNRKDIVFIVLIALSVILWAYFFNSSGLGLKEIFKFSAINSTIDKILSAPFILFLLSFPLTIALITIYSKIRGDKIISIISCLIGVIIGFLVSALAFSNIAGLWIAGIFYLIGVILLIEMTYTRLQELKKYIAFRLLGEASHKIVLFTAIGLFLSSALITFADNEKYTKDLEQNMIKTVLGGMTGKENSLAEAAADQMISVQRETVQQLTAQEQFQALKTSSDPNAQAYALTIEQLQNKMETEEYKQAVMKEVQKNVNEKIIGEEQIQTTLDSMKEKMPLYGIVMKFMWLIEAFGVMSIFLLIGNTIFWFLSVVYGLTINLVAENIPNKIKQSI